MVFAGPWQNDIGNSRRRIIALGRRTNTSSTGQDGTFIPQIDGEAPASPDRKAAKAAGSAVQVPAREAEAPLAQTITQPELPLRPAIGLLGMLLASLLAINRTGIESLRL